MTGPGPTRIIDIARTRNADPITIFLQDWGAGRGRMTIVCASQAWTCSWGAMGASLLDFVADNSAGYIGGSMMHGSTSQLRFDRQHAETVAATVISELKRIRDESRKEERHA